MEKLHARIILEILGRPPEHIKDSLSLLIEKISKEKGVSIIESKIHEPVPVQDSKDLFTTFAEVTLELDSIDNYFGIMFAYMPSNIELIKPEDLTFTNDSFSLLGNKIISRLHEYDALAKRLISEREKLIMKLKEVAPHLFKKQEVQNNNPVAESKKSSVKKMTKKKAKTKKTKRA